MEQTVSIKEKRPKAATNAYVVLKPIHYLKDNQPTTIEKGRVILGRYAWCVETAMYPVQLEKYIAQGYIEKVKTKEYLKRLNAIEN